MDLELWYNKVAIDLNRMCENDFKFFPIPGFPFTDILGSFLPSIRARHPRDIYPKLNNDFIYLPSRDGILLRTDRQMLQLSGDHLYLVLRALDPVLTGGNSLEAISSALTPNGQTQLIRLIKFLIEAGCIKDCSAERDQDASDSIRIRFQQHLDLIDHVAGHAYPKFTAFRKCRILLTGTGHSYQRCAADLIRHGLIQLYVLPSALPDRNLEEAQRILREAGFDQTSTSIVQLCNAERHAQALSQFDLIIYCSDYPSLRDLIFLARAACQESSRFLPGFVVSRESILGPLVNPISPCCWPCRVLRGLEDTRDRRFKLIHKLFAKGVSPPRCSTPDSTLVQTLGRDIAFEAFKILVGDMRPQTESNMILQLIDNEGSIEAKVVMSNKHACLNFCRVWQETDD